MHIDIRPYDRNQTYQTADDAKRAAERIYTDATA